MVTTAFIGKFCVERDGVSLLDYVSSGHCIIATTTTSLLPNAIIKEGDVVGLHANWFGDLSYKSSAKNALRASALISW